jgi:3-methyladenine DNA glycosylase AlkD
MPGNAPEVRRGVLSPGAPAIAAGIAAALAGSAAATIPELRGIRRALSGRLREAPAPDVIEAAFKLSQIPRRGCRFVAYELIAHHPQAPMLLDARRLERIGRGMASWDAVDCFSVFLAGPAWRRGTVPSPVIHAWARSADRWWRRAALVSTVPLNSRAHGGKGDSRRTLRVCRILERDRDPMVYKALSWALRELSKRDPEAVRRFLSERSGALAATVLREVRNKLETGLKNPGRRGNPR